MASRDAEAAAVGVAAAVAAAGEGTIRGTEEDGRRQEGRETDPGLVRATEFAIVRARALRLRAAVRALALERRRLREQRPTATTTIYVDKLDFRVSDCKCSM